MLNITILKSELKDFNYYKNKIPMFLQQSYGFVEHFRIWYDLLVSEDKQSIVGFADAYFALLNIFDLTIDAEGNIDDGNEDDYLAYLLTYSDDVYVCDVLDKLGALFGLTRRFSVSYTYKGTIYSSSLNLTNAEFITLIKAQIIKNYCNGTYEQLSRYYQSLGLYVFILYSGIPANADVILQTENDSTELTPIEKMFLSGLLTIQSMGIQYTYSIVNTKLLLRWDTENKFWNVQRWGI